MPPRPQWGDRCEFWHAGSHRRHNNRQIFCQLVQGFGSSDPQDFAISIGLAGRSYNSVSTAVLHCDNFNNIQTRCFVVIMITTDKLYSYRFIVIDLLIDWSIGMLMVQGEQYRQQQHARVVRLKVKSLSFYIWDVQHK